MKSKFVFKIMIDILMTIILLFLMVYHIVGEKRHEWLGMVMGILFILHIILNRWWYINLPKGKYTLFRWVQTIINISITITMISSMVTGIIMSHYVFIFVPINKSISSARVIHMLAAYWGFALMSLHLGLHWGMILGMLNKLYKFRGISLIALRIVGIAVVINGIYTFFRLDLLSYMLMKNEYVFFDFNQSTVSALSDYFTIMGFLVFIAYYSMKFLHRKVS